MTTFKKTSVSHTRNKGLKLIAGIKLLRGLVAICISFSLFYAALNLDQKPINAYPFINKLVQKDGIFELAFTWVSEFHKTQIISLALLVILLGLMRWFEAYGLWSNKTWGKSTALITGTIYIPFEINEIHRELSLSMFILLAINVLVVLYLAKRLLEPRKTPATN